MPKLSLKYVHFKVNRSLKYFVATTIMLLAQFFSGTNYEDITVDKEVDVHRAMYFTKIIAISFCSFHTAFVFIII